MDITKKHMVPNSVSCPQALKDYVTSTGLKNIAWLSYLLKSEMFINTLNIL